MIPELGSFALILALGFALIQSVAPFFKQNRLVASATLGQFIFLAFAMLCLIISFLNNDMTVLFVREHSHTLLPFMYRVGAAWGGHEGSLLLWCLVLSGWTTVFLAFSHKYKTHISADKIIGILGGISVGFILFLFATSNPFKRDFPTSFISGEDLTPVLQDPGLIFHPPMLYLGYVGFAIGFAFAIVAMLEGKLTREWAAACRPWIVLPWAFLGCGIVLGSWWAYRELGWGGWWFWDPVENASLLPWLSATALIHSLIVCEKREAFKGWTLLLAIVTFALSLLGTFLVRSGVLVSVHAFTNDPQRGLYLLGYLTLIIGGALTLYTYRIKDFYQAPNFKLFSRETFMLVNSVILLSAVATIVIGTIYPIILDALNYGKISVGEPYFNAVFLPMVIPLLLLMSFAPHVNWGSQSLQKLWHSIRASLLLAIILSIAGPWYFGFAFHWLAAFGIFLSVWIIASTIEYVLQLQQKFALNHWAMVVAHIGIAITALGITINKSYSEERQVRLNVGESIMLAGYEFTLKNIHNTNEQNFTTTTIDFDVQRNSHLLAEIAAEQRTYKSHDQALSKPGILSNGIRDLYLAIGGELEDKSWSIRIYYKPCVRLIWLGGFILLLGGMLSIVNYLRKYVK